MFFGALTRAIIIRIIPASGPRASTKPIGKNNALLNMSSMLVEELKLEVKSVMPLKIELISGAPK